MLEFAQAKELFYERDSYGNELVKRPACSGKNPDICVLIHGHTAAAAGLMKELIEDTDHTLPALELLYTHRDLGDGRSSTRYFDTDKLHARYLIDLDGDRENEIVSSCAGFVRLQLRTEFYRIQPGNGWIPVDIRMYGLHGGHSANDIQEGRGNAIRLMGEFLFDWYNYSIDTQLVGIYGGQHRNMIPSACTARIWIHEEQRENLDRGCWWFGEDLAKRYGTTDPDARIEVSYPEIDRADASWWPMSPDVTGRILSFLNMCPNGMINMTPGEEGQVETSCNIRRTDTAENRWELSVTIRSQDDSQKDALREKFELLAQMNHLEIFSTSDFPSWMHHTEANLQKQYEMVYEKLFGKDLHVISDHEEHENMIFVDKMPDLEAISIGPDIVEGEADAESLARVKQALFTLLSE